MMTSKKRVVDGGYAWVVLGALVLIDLQVGMMWTCVGILTTAIVEEIDDDITKASLVGSTFLGTTTLMGPVSGLLQDRLGHRWTGVVSGILLLVGFTSASFCKTITGLICTFGFIAGSGGSLAMNVTGVAPGSYFVKKLSIAYGLLQVGGGCGVFVVGPITISLLDNYQLSGTLLILGAIMFNVSLAGALIRPNSVIEDEERIIDPGPRPADALDENERLVDPECPETSIAEKEQLIDSMCSDTVSNEEDRLSMPRNVNTSDADVKADADASTHSQKGKDDRDTSGAVLEMVEESRNLLTDDDDVEAGQGHSCIPSPSSDDDVYSNTSEGTTFNNDTVPSDGCSTERPTVEELTSDVTDSCDKILNSPTHLSTASAESNDCSGYGNTNLKIQNPNSMEFTESKTITVTPVLEAFVIEDKSSEIEDKRTGCLTIIITEARGLLHILFSNGFYVYLLSSLFWTLGDSTCLLHLPNYAESKGSTPTQSANLFTGMGVASIVSSVLSGFVVSDPAIGNILINFGSLGMTGILTVLFPLYSFSYPLQILFITLYGLYSQAPYTLVGPLCIQLVGIKNLGFGYGLASFVTGLGFLAGPPLASLLYENSGVYDYSFIFAGCCLLTAAFLLALVPMFEKNPKEEGKAMKE